MKKSNKSKKNTGIVLWNKAKKLIPGGNQFLSKRSEMFLPEQWPSYYSKAKGCEIWDLDGNRYLDMGIMSVGNSLLGYADPDVNRAVKKAIDEGITSTLNAPEEVELAEELLKLHPWAQMVRYARGGGEAMAIAIRIARAYTKKDKIAFCGYHGWADWYLAANLETEGLVGQHLSGLDPAGVPQGLAGTMYPFHYNHIEELEAIVKKHGKDIGVIVMEPMKGQAPEDDFLKKVRKIADSIDAILIFDEVSIGWKMTLGGSHLLYKMNPDIAVFSKAISNGFAMAAIIGKKAVMEAAQVTFMSSTNWSERTGLVAALATIKKMKKLKVAARLQKVGARVQKIWTNAGRKHGLDITVGGLAPFSSFSFNYGDQNQALKTLYIQEMLGEGILATTALFASYAHTDKHLDTYEKAVDRVFARIKKAIDSETVEKSLNGPLAHTGFARLN